MNRFVLNARNKFQNHHLYFRFPEECVGVRRIIVIDKSRVSNIFLIWTEINWYKRKIRCWMLWRTLQILTKPLSTFLAPPLHEQTGWKNKVLTVCKWVICLDTTLPHWNCKPAYDDYDDSQDDIRKHQVLCHLSSLSNKLLVLVDVSCATLSFWVLCFHCHFISSDNKSKVFTITTEGIHSNHSKVILVMHRLKSIWSDFNSHGKFIDIFCKRYGV